jgi:hypothetical protein
VYASDRDLLRLVDISAEVKLFCLEFHFRQEKEFHDARITTTGSRPCKRINVCQKEKKRATLQLCMLVEQKMQFSFTKSSHTESQLARACVLSSRRFVEVGD